MFIKLMVILQEADSVAPQDSINVHIGRKMGKMGLIHGKGESIIMFTLL